MPHFPNRQKIGPTDPDSNASGPRRESLSRHWSMPTLADDADDGYTRNKHVVFSLPSDSQLEITNESNSDVQITLDKPPNIDHYRLTLQNMRQMQQAGGSGIANRASMMELMTGKSMEPPTNQSRKTDPEKLDHFEEPIAVEIKKTNWFEGVHIPVFTNIVGSLLYLRMGWVAGQAGIVMGSVVVIFSTLLIVITALSFCGICSNGELKKGGLYYLLSRSLGPEYGGSIGLLFSFANVGLAALYLIAFGETVVELMDENGYQHILNSTTNDIRLISVVTCIVLMVITFMGPSIEMKFTLVFFSLYHISMLDWVLGSLLPVNEHQQLRGITGYSWQVTKTNMWESYRGKENFISVFAVFFPGMTGMMAGTAVVDELQNPDRDVPLGMFTAIINCAVYYLIGLLISGATAIREVSGTELPVHGQLSHQNFTYFPCTENATCKYGLMNYFQMTKTQSAWGPLIIIGICAMTISSTMTNLENGPMIFQAVCRDRLFPHLKYFSKLTGNDNPNAPKRPFIFFAFLTMLMTLSGNLNTINGFVTNLFLAVYSMVNYATFDASLAKAPGFRPSFRFYNMWLSLCGAALNVIVMFIVDWLSALAILISFALIFVYIHHRQPDVNWGSTAQAHNYRTALASLWKLTTTEEHVKNYRPQILLLSGNPASRSSLLDFTQSITKGDSLLITAHVILYPPNERLFRVLKILEANMRDWMRRNRIKAFYLPMANENLRCGTQNLLQIVGLGRLRPNVLILGFKRDWQSSEKLNDYVGIIRDAFQSNFGVGILRNRDDGLDLSTALIDNQIDDITEFKISHQESTNELTVNNMENGSGSMLDLGHSRINLDDDGGVQEQKATRKITRFFADNFVFDPDKSEQKRAAKELEQVQQRFGIKDPNIQSDSLINLAQSINRFHKRVRNGTIDVWWLYDDGGLTLLIPHLLRLEKSYLMDAKLRVFTIATAHACMQSEAQNMAAMLSKFRIAYADVRVIPDISRKPHPQTLRDFEEMISRVRRSEAGLLDDADLATHRARTYRQLRTRELLQQFSYEADLIVVTLPVPREKINPALYMTWIDLMTKDLPPVLMVRGNQTSVLTFYT